VLAVAAAPALSANAAAGLKFSMWREEDFMRRCGIDFWVIPRSFFDEKESRPPHCSRGN
jgi:hypothetical protein